MRVVWNIVGAIFAIFGAIWLLQGINVIHAGFMAGQLKWAVYGGILLVVGILILIGVNRKRHTATPAG